MTRASDFLALHRPGDPLLLPNPWDAGSAKCLVALGFQALATTSGGFAATLGREDGHVTRDEALAHCATMAAAVQVPINADLEDGFGRSPEGVAATMRLVPATGVAGCSLEDFSGGALVETTLAAERVQAAREALGDAVVLVGRAENYLRGRPDLHDTIARLVAYQEAGADVLYAPFVTSPHDLRAILSSIDRPFNALLRPDGPSVRELADLGVARISVGSAFTYATYGALVDLAADLRQDGPQTYFDRVGPGQELLARAFSREH